jgi:kynureninase
MDASGSDPREHDDLLDWRVEFPILQKTVYLISNSLGAMPRAVYESLRDYAEAWAVRGVRAWGDSWWEMPVRLGDLLAPIVGADPGQISFHQNVTIAQAIVSSCFDFSGARRKIVLNELEFPSLLYFYQAQKRRGAEVAVVRSQDGGLSIDLDALLTEIDETTLLVPVSHVLFRSSYIMDVAAIVRKAHDVGALVVVDIYQSAGCAPVNVAEWGVDFAVGGCLKWLCGGPGAAFLYVKPALRDRLEPALTGWMAHQSSFAFDPGEIAYRNDAFRFLNGTPHVPCLYAARPGLEIIGKIGMERIRRKSMRQTELLVKLAASRGLQFTAPLQAERRGGTVAINPPHAYEVSRELLRREFLVDYRPGSGIRIAPHFYTSDAELEAVVAEIGDILESGAYARHAGPRSYVT